MITLANNSKTYTVQYNSLDGNRYEITATKEGYSKYRIKKYLLETEDNIERPIQQVINVNGKAYHSMLAKDQNCMKTWIWNYVDNDEKRD